MSEQGKGSAQSTRKLWPRPDAPQRTQRFTEEIRCWKKIVRFLSGYSLIHIARGSPTDLAADMFYIGDPVGCPTSVFYAFSSVSSVSSRTQRFTEEIRCWKKIVRFLSGYSLIHTARGSQPTGLFSGEDVLYWRSGRLPDICLCV